MTEDYEMKKKLFALLIAFTMVFALAACGGGAGSSEEVAPGVDIGVVKVGIDGNYTPFQFTNDDGTFDGFEIAMLNEVSSRTGIEVEYVPCAWDGIFGQMDSEKIDTVMCCVFPSVERLEKYDFSREYIYDENLFIVPEGKAHDYKTVADFKGKKIGVSSGGNSFLRLQDAQEEGGFEIKAYGNDEEIFDLDLGRLDAIYKSPVFALAAAKENNLHVEVADCPPLEEATCALPWRKDDERSAAIREAFSGAIQEMIDDGTMKDLSEKYFGMDVTAYEPMHEF